MKTYTMPLAVAGALLLTFVAPVTLPEAAAAPVRETRISDVNCDGVADIVVAGWQAGLTPHSEDGHISVAYGGSALPPQRINGADIGVPVAVRTYLWVSEAITADLNRDGCADIVVSDRQSHTVRVLWGSRTGLSASRTKVLIRKTDTHRGVHALAYVPLPTPVLAVSTRERTGSSVRLYPVKADGSLGTSRLISLSTAGITGKATAAAQFGTALGAADDLLVIGAPQAQVGKVKKAGAVYVLRMLGALKFKAVRVTQATAGIPGIAESYDRFGSSVSVFADHLAIGVPSEITPPDQGIGLVHNLQVVRSGRSVAVRSVGYLTSTDPALPSGPPLPTGLWYLGSSVTVYRPCDSTLGTLVGTGTSATSLYWAVQYPFTPAAGCPIKLLTDTTTATLNDVAGVLRQAPGSPVAEKVLVPTETGVDVRSADGTVAAVALPHLPIDYVEWIVRPAA